jgi:hypothetical protein
MSSGTGVREGGLSVDVGSPLQEIDRQVSGVHARCDPDTLLQVRTLCGVGLPKCAQGEHGGHGCGGLAGVQPMSCAQREGGCQISARWAGDSLSQATMQPSCSPQASARCTHLKCEVEVAEHQERRGEGMEGGVKLCMPVFGWVMIHVGERMLSHPLTHRDCTAGVRGEVAEGQRPAVGVVRVRRGRGLGVDRRHGGEESEEGSRSRHGGRLVGLVCCVKTIFAMSLRNLKHAKMFGAANWWEN